MSRNSLEAAKNMEIVLKIITIRHWKNGHLQCLVREALKGNLDLKYTDFKNREKMIEELNKHGFSV
jgi:hypothetical protein